MQTPEAQLMPTIPQYTMQDIGRLLAMVEQAVKNSEQTNAALKEHLGKCETATNDQTKSNAEIKAGIQNLNEKLTDYKDDIKELETNQKGLLMRTTRLEEQVNRIYWVVGISAPVALGALIAALTGMQITS